jgi:hypothetical protein
MNRTESGRAQRLAIGMADDQPLVAGLAPKRPRR